MIAIHFVGYVIGYVAFPLPVFSYSYFVFP